MSASNSGRAALLRALAAGLPPPGPFPLRSTEPDPGLFGPGSATWRVMREPLLILGSARALLVQTAHPLVAQGAIDHSDFAADPVGRFQRTAGWVTTVVFGTREEALEATRRVNQLHRPVRGELPAESSTPAWAGGSRYRAQDQPLVLWVHASLLDAMLSTYRSVVGSLPPRQADRFVREWDRVGGLLGLPPGSTWSSETAMRRWIEARMREGTTVPGAGSLEVARVILAPGVSGPLLAHLTGLITAGLLPPPLRRAYRVPWSPAHELAYRSLTLSLRMSRPALPRLLRVSPAYDFAQARIRGQLRRETGREERLRSELRLA